MTIGVWVGSGVARRGRRASRARATSSSTCCSRAPTTRSRARDRRGGRVGRRRDERVHHAGAHRVLRARARRRTSTSRSTSSPTSCGRPAFRPDEVEAERQVILEEIGMRDDTPDDLVHDLFAEALFPEHPLGREVLGTRRARSRRCRATRSPRSTPRTTGRRTSWSPPPATSTTTRSSTLVDAALPGAIDGDAPAAADAAGRRAPSRSRSLDRADRAGAPRRSACARCAALDPDRYALDGRRTRCSAAACRAGCSRRSASSAASRTRCTRTARAFDDTGSLAVYAGTAPERRRTRRSTSIDAELDRLVADGHHRRASSTAAKGHLTGSLALSLETRRAACAASAAPSSSTARSRRSTSSSRAIEAVTADDVAPGDRPGAAPTRRGRSPSSARSTTSDFADAALSATRRRRYRAAAMIRVGVFGAGGRMGATVCRAVLDDPELELVAAVDPHARRASTSRQLGVDAEPADRAPTPSALADAGAEVAVDFTVHRRRPREPRVVRRERRARGRRHHRLHRRRARRASREPLRGVDGQRGDRAELRDRRGADDALRRAGRAVLRDRRDHRAAPRPEDRRAVGHRDAHGASAWPRRRRDWARRPDHARSSPRARAAAPAPAGIRVHSVRLRGPGRPPGGAARHHRARR